MTCAGGVTGRDSWTPPPTSGPASRATRGGPPSGGAGDIALSRRGHGSPQALAGAHPSAGFAAPPADRLVTPRRPADREPRATPRSRGLAPGVARPPSLSDRGVLAPGDRRTVESRRSPGCTRLLRRARTARRVTPLRLTGLDRRPTRRSSSGWRRERRPSSVGSTAIVTRRGSPWSPGGRLLEQARHDFVLEPVGDVGAFEALVAFSPTPLGESLPSFAEARQATQEHWRRFWSTGGAIDLSAEPRLAVARARAPDRALAVPHRHPVRRPLSPAGDGAHLQQLVRQVPPRDALVARRALRALGPPAAARAEPRLLRGHPAAGARHGAPAGLRRRALAEDDRPERGGVAFHRRAVPRLAAAAPDLLRRARLPRAPRPRDARALPRGRASRRRSSWRPSPRGTRRVGASCSGRRSRARRRSSRRSGRPTPPSSSPTGAGASRRRSAGASGSGSRATRGGSACSTACRRCRSPTGRYLFAETAPASFTDPHFARDHPSVLGALGMLPGDGVDRPTMRRTFDWVWQNWSWPDTWGWDYPLVAMSAARLGRAGAGRRRAPPRLAEERVPRERPQPSARGPDGLPPRQRRPAGRGGDDGRRLGRGARRRCAGLPARRELERSLGRPAANAID